MTVVVRSAQPTDLAAIATLASSQQHIDERHVPYLGLDAASIAEDIGGLGDWAAYSAVVEVDGGVVGCLVPEIDDEMGRVWWLGPYVAGDPGDVAAWNNAADSLYLLARSEMPERIDEEEALGDSRSDLIRDWCARFAMTPNEGSVLLRLDGDPSISSREESGPRMRTVERGDHRVVAALHDLSFPDTHTTSAALLASSDPRMVVEIDGQVVGYVAYEVQSDNSGYIDYLAVEPGSQTGGLGGELVLHACTDLFQRGVDYVHLSVREGNLAARSLYARVGFIEERVAVPYRKGFALE